MGDNRLVSRVDAPNLSGPTESVDLSNLCEAVLWPRRIRTWGDRSPVVEGIGGHRGGLLRRVVKPYQSYL